MRSSIANWRWWSVRWIERDGESWAGLATCLASPSVTAPEGLCRTPWTRGALGWAAGQWGGGPSLSRASVTPETRQCFNINFISRRVGLALYRLGIPFTSDYGTVSEARKFVRILFSWQNRLHLLSHEVTSVYMLRCVSPTIPLSRYLYVCSRWQFFTTYLPNSLAIHTSWRTCHCLLEQTASEKCESLVAELYHRLKTASFWDFFYNHSVKTLSLHVKKVLHYGITAENNTDSSVSLCLVN
jgi:hypothetical protein